ncbi:MAG: dTMP kinase [Candidatus Diapherotrites archaeon]|nr:dTMP kinase [Candidatus Diapherotrites archaeon]
MERGFFVVVDGIDGCGKSTVIKGIKDFLISLGINRNKIFITKEPSNSIFGHKIKEILRKQKNEYQNKELITELYLKDRKEHVKKEILPALKDSKIVLCDRYIYSTIAYQSAQGMSMEELIKQNEEFTKPNVVIILDIDPKDAIKRINLDKNRDKKELFEKEEFLKKVRENFLKLKALMEDENIIIIDGSKPKEDVIKEVKNILEKSLLE